jgi:hypothetical protein
MFPHLCNWNVDDITNGRLGILSVYRAFYHHHAAMRDGLRLTCLHIAEPGPAITARAGETCNRNRETVNLASDEWS